MIKNLLNVYYQNKWWVSVWFAIVFLIAFVFPTSLGQSILNAYIFFVYYNLPILQIIYFLFKFKENNIYKYVYLVIIAITYLHLIIKFGFGYTNEIYEGFAIFIFFASLIYNAYILRHLNKSYRNNNTMAINLFFSFLLYFPVGIWLLHGNFKALNEIVNKEGTLHE